MWRERGSRIGAFREPALSDEVIGSRDAQTTTPEAWREHEIVRRRVLTLAGILIIAALLASCGGGDKKLDLRLRLEAGKSYGTKMVADQIITQTLGGQTQIMTQSIGMAYTYDVQGVETDGTMRVKVTYDWVRVAQDGPMGSFSYDSAHAPATIPEAARAYTALVGQGFFLQLRPNGEIVDVQGVDQMLAHMLDAMGVPAGSERDELEASLRSQFGNEALKESFEKAALFYPDKPVAVGDSWSKDISLETGMPMVLATTWTLKARKDGVAVVETRSDVRRNPEAKPVEMAGMTIAYELSGEQSGSMELDEKTGWLLNGTMKQNLAGQISAMGMTWPMTVVSDIRFEPWGK